MKIIQKQQEKSVHFKNTWYSSGKVLVLKTNVFNLYINI